MEESSREAREYTNSCPNTKSSFILFTFFLKLSLLKITLKHFLIFIRPLQLSPTPTRSQMLTNPFPLRSWQEKRRVRQNQHLGKQNFHCQQTVRISKAINPKFINLNSCQFLLLLCTNQCTYMER